MTPEQHIRAPRDHNPPSFRSRELEVRITPRIPMTFLLREASGRPGDRYIAPTLPGRGPVSTFPTRRVYVPGENDLYQAAAGHPEAIRFVYKV